MRIRMIDDDELDDEEGFEDWLYGKNIDKRPVWIEKYNKKMGRGVIYFLFLNIFRPSMSVTYSKPISISWVTSCTFLAVLTMYSSSSPSSIARM